MTEINITPKLKQAILDGRAKLIISEDRSYQEGLSERDNQEYYWLVKIESTNTFIPLIILPENIREAAYKLRTLGIRGKTWFFECPVCGSKSFYSPGKNGERCCNYE